MISIEVEAKALIIDMSRDSGASTVVRKLDGQIRVEVANGHRVHTWSFAALVHNKTKALRDVRADMEASLRRVGIGLRAETDFAAQVLAAPRGRTGPIGDRMLETVARRIGRPVETEQPDVTFDVPIPAKKQERKELRDLKQRVAEIEREMASVKQITDQLR